MTFTEHHKYGRSNNADDTTARATTTGAGLAIGGPVGAALATAAYGLTSGLNAKMENAANEGLINFLKKYGTRGLTYYPTKGEMLAAAKNGNWEAHIVNSIATAYDEKTGTWSWTLDDWKGAVVSNTPIKAYIFKGSGEQYLKTSNINAIGSAGEKQLQVLNNNKPIDYKNPSTISPSLLPVLNQLGYLNNSTGSTPSPSSSQNPPTSQPNLSASVMGSGVGNMMENPVILISMILIVGFAIVLLIKPDLI